MKQVFRGQILGVGTASGTRIVVGRWPDSPYGDFADCMIARPDGRRILLAPTDAVAEFVSGTYHFDEVRVVPVAARVTPRGTDGATHWDVDAGPLRLAATTGGRTPLGGLLRAVPPALATSTALTAVTDPIARVVLAGVRTRGTAGNGRREYYGATDVHAVTGVDATWDGADLGGLTDVHPAPNFGFSSTPRRPSVVDVTTTVDLPVAAEDHNAAGPGR